MPTLSRMLPAALALFLATSLAVTVDGAATASPVTVAPTAPPQARTAAPATDRGALDLGADAVLPRRDGRTAKVQKWNVRTLWYYETLPAKWDWSLSTAVAKWNASGGRIKLARTVLPRKAQVRIGYGKIGSAAGLATVGATRNAYVRLSSRFGTMDAVNARNRVTIMNVFAHELGHVLGFQHTSARCSLMAPVINVDACNVVPTAEPGYYKCRTIDTTLEQRFIRMYGGSARYPSATWCLIDPLPPVLNGVNFSDGISSPVTVHWTRPAPVLAGSTLVVKRWQASTCGAAPSWADTFRPSVTSGVWQDQVTHEDEVDCFQVQLLNRYGAGRAAQRALRSRWVPSPDAPVLGTPSYDAELDQFTFSATLPDGATLHAGWDSAHPTTCITTPTGETDGAFVQVVNGTGTMASPGALPQCVSFFAYDQDTHRFSDPFTMTFTVPEQPDAPDVDFASWNPADHSFLAPATYPAGTHLVYLVDDDDASVCPGTYTSGGQAVVQDPDRPGVVQFFTALPDACVSFYAVDDETGLVSDPTSIVAEAPLPSETPNMTALGLQYEYPWWQARVDGVTPGNKVGYMSFAGHCPDTAPTITRWYTHTYGDIYAGAPQEVRDDLFFPSRAAGVNCVVFTSLDWFGWSGSGPVFTGAVTDRHGPVVMREFVDEGPLPPAVGDPLWDPDTGTFTMTVNVNFPLAIFDPSDPATCIEPGAPGAQQLSVEAGTGFVHITPPAEHTCVTFYQERSQGPVPMSKGTQVDLQVPQG